MSRKRLEPFQPRIAEMPAVTMAVVRTTGDPSATAGDVMKSLYGAVWPMKMARKKADRPFTSPMMPRARWEGFGSADTLRGTWGLQVPDDTEPGELARDDSPLEVEVERWEYGPTAEVLHVGDYADEQSTIDLLTAYAEDHGYEVIGPHEEEYLSGPDEERPRTIIRYRVKPAGDRDVAR